ncbi:MAG: type II toxin-antitoxin system RelE/ParE family toxin [Promethearchaeia archaeon]|nr:MAG: type II toxin-antitoxin system RelE/ParE family toxin [Candidatus Lokiarchaeia archaeon]
MNFIIFHPEAEIELNSTIDFYNRKVSGLGFEFLEKIERAINLIDRNPDRWQILKYRVRKYIVKQFPYSIYYIFDPNRIYVVAIAHQKRKPFYWKDRL